MKVGLPLVLLIIVDLSHNQPLLPSLHSLPDLLTGLGPRMLQAVTAGGTTTTTTITQPAMVTTPVVTSMTPPVMPSVLPVIFAVAVIKALMLEKMKDKEDGYSHHDPYYGGHHHSLNLRRNGFQIVKPTPKL